jgi:hypothetical protein
MPDDGLSDLRTEVPEHASERATQMWSKHPFARLKDLLFPTEETAEDYAAALIESFNAEDLQRIINEKKTLVELAIRGGRLDNRWVRPWARVIIRRNAKAIYSALVGWPDFPDTGPSGIVRRADLSEPGKAAILRSPDGWAWLTWSCYKLALFLQQYAEIRDWPLILPPPLPDVDATVRLPPPEG